MRKVGGLSSSLHSLSGWHAPVGITFTGQWFASGFLQPPPHSDALAIGCTLPTVGRVRDFYLFFLCARRAHRKRGCPENRQPLHISAIEIINLIRNLTMKLLQRLHLSVSMLLHIADSLKGSPGCCNGGHVGNFRLDGRFPQITVIVYAFLSGR